MADWLVNIVLSGSGETSFEVDGFTQGQPLDAHQDDLVTWNNQTNDEHQPWQTDSSYEPLTNGSLVDPIPKGQPSITYNCSSPAANPQHWTVYYYCRNHPDNPKERGTINVTAWPITYGGSGLSATASTANYTNHDTISWFNHSTAAHQPWQTDANYKPLPAGSLSAVLQPGDKSAPYAVPPPPPGSPAPYTIYYFCYLHQNVTTEQGKIVATPDG